MIYLLGPQGFISARTEGLTALVLPLLFRFKHCATDRKWLTFSAAANSPKKAITDLQRTLS